MGLKERGQQAMVNIANEYTRPWYKKGEYWVGIIANVIAIIALLK